MPAPALAPTKLAPDCRIRGRFPAVWGQFPERVGALLAAAALLAVGGCATTGADEPTRSAGQAGYVGVQANLTRIPPDHRLPVPAVSGRALGGGQTLSTQGHPGQVVVVNVWGSWCPPCRSEAPELEAASQQTRRVAQFLGITVKDYDPAPAEAFVRVHKITYPSIYDPTGATLLPFAAVLPPSAIPSTLILDRQHRLAVRVLGPITKTTLVDMIHDVAAGT